jgi:hypothetical protein
MFFYSNELQVGKFQVEKLTNVWRPHLKSLPLNCYMSQNKTFTRSPQTLEKLSCKNLKFDLKLVTLAKNNLWHTWNLKLKDLKNTFPHLRTYNTLKKSFPHLPLTWKSCKLLVCHHLEMNSHSLWKLNNLLSKGFFPFFYAIQAENPSLFILTQCPFSCLVWAHNLLETTWKLARNETLKVHEMEQLY